MDRILVSDLDGTFLDADGSIPDCAFLFRDKLLRADIELVFATARPPSDSVVQYLLTNLSNWVICNDGAVSLRRTNENVTVFKEIDISFSIFESYSNFLLSLGFFPFYFMNSLEGFKVFVHKTVHRNIKEELRRANPNRIIEYYDNLEDITPQNVRAISLFGPANDGLAREVMNLRNGDASILYYDETRFGNYKWLDIISSKVNKFYMLQNIIEELGHDCVDFSLGNGSNDLLLMKNSIWSACPKTADAKIARIATYQSEEEEGSKFLHDIAKFLEISK